MSTRRNWVSASLVAAFLCVVLLGACNGSESGNGAGNCEVETPAALDTTCDGVDDDCDGVVDDDYASVATSCGVGACAAVGNTACIVGYIEDSCTAGTPSADDATCDGVDDDCDGVVDDDYTSVATSCGEGECAAEGSTSCVSGVVEDSCAPATCPDGSACTDGVCPQDTAPVVSVSVSPPIANVGEAVVIIVTAMDDIGIIAESVSVAGVAQPLDASHQANWSGDTPGAYEVVATAEDTAGNVSTATSYARVRDENDVAFPTAQITAPADEATMTEPADIVGTASDANFFRYSLEYKEPDSGAWVLFKESFTPVNNAALGSLNTMQIENGFYDVRLTVEDVNGQMVSVVRRYQIDGQAKFGTFTMAYSDLNLPAAGMDLTVERVYDSRVKSKRDFGVGWSLSLKRGHFEHLNPPNTHWTITEGGNPWVPLPCQTVSEQATHVTDVRLSEHERYRFAMQLTNLAAIQGACTGDVSYSYSNGTVPGAATLQILGDPEFLYLIGNPQLYTWNFEDFDITQVRLTTPDKRVFDLVRGRDGVYRRMDANANQIDISTSGASHSSDLGVTFVRDSENRIIQVTAPSGRTLTYAYDTRGDLVAATDPLGNTTFYTYDNHHNLVGIKDPCGRLTTRLEYNAMGRLIAVIDPNDERIELEHDPDLRTEIVADRLGATEQLEYDARGNIVRLDDKIGDTYLYTYDAHDRKLTETNPDLGVTTYLYDGSGRLASVTDPLGVVRSMTWNSLNLPLTQTNPNGDVTTYTYDEKGNLLTKTDPEGFTTTHTYDSRGLRTSTTDPMGYLTTWTYETVGRMATVTNALGTTTAYTYDADGNKLSETVTRTGPSGPEVLTTQFDYDDNARLVAMTDALGNQSEVTYDLCGNKIAEIDALGHVTSYEYDHKGNRVLTKNADNTTETAVYDSENRLISKTDRAGRITTTAYDALRRPVEVTSPDGSMRSRSYGWHGGLLTETDPLGNTMTFGYDAIGRLLSVTNPLGDTTTYTYDGAGNRRTTTGADGETTEFTYNSNDRLVATFLPDGTSEGVAYDANGRIVTRTDAAGNTTTYDFDALGRLIRITDALGGVIVYSYDELGNRTSETDANGNTVTQDFDALGRRIQRTLPLGQTMQWQYDAVGNLLKSMDANGETTTYIYDAMKRLVQLTRPDGSIETTAYTAGGERSTVTDARGTTTWTYDVMDRVVSRTDPDGEMVSVGYDLQGNPTSVTTAAGVTSKTYDGANRLNTVIDPDGGLSTYAYNPTGNLISLTAANGVATTYTYDANGRLTGIEIIDGASTPLASFSYTLDPVGNPIQVVEGHSGRVVDTTYDALYRLTGEVIDDPDNGDRTTSYSYDPVGNRIALTDSVDGSVTFTYDGNDRLVSLNGFTRSYDENGNLLQSATPDGTFDYAYDSCNRLAAVDHDDITITYTYDQDGYRIGRTVNDGTTLEETRYVVDAVRKLTRVLVEKDGSGVIRTHYVYGNALLSQSRGGFVFYYGLDGWNSVRLLTDDDGAVTDTYDYSGFGEILSQSGTTTNEHLYGGQYLDANTGHYYSHPRWYEPGAGRFLTANEDQALNCQDKTLHRYAYNMTDPINQ